MIQIKRVYDEPESSDGKRFLVERLWPRGMKKEKLKMDSWVKDVAPSHELRQWFNHDPERWEEFQRRYRKELENHEEAWGMILEAGKTGNVTLIYSARDEQHNNAAALKKYLEEKMR
jgi:uncharacterized protein YeaO (DUF488 family)